MLLDVLRNSCTWRRKSILSKLMPAAFQVFVVIGVWQLLKSRDSADNKADHRKARSINDDYGERLSPLCSPGEYATGDRLTLDSIISREDEGMLSKSAIQPLVLNVELFVRDADMGTLVLYPAGTPVILGGLFRKEVQANAGDDLHFFDDTVEDRFKDIVGESNRLSKQDVPGNDPENGEAARSQMELETALESGGAVQDKPNINKLLLDEEMLRVRPEDQRGQKQIIEEFKDIGSMQDKDRRDGVGIGLHKFQLKDVGLQAGRQSSQAKVTQTFVTRNDPNGQVTKFDQYGKFTSQNPSNKVTRPSYDDRTIRVATKESAADPSHIDEHSPLAEGFEDRVKKFKYEYFGRYIDESHRTGNVPIPHVIINHQRCGFPERIDILILINSLPQSSEQRQRIRDTFVASKFFQSYTIAYVFLLGVGSSTFQTNLKHESLMYGDVVQGDFQDTPENASLKGLMGLRWVIDFCPRVDFVMKIDEGVFVDSDKLLNGLLPVVKKHAGKRSILCAFNPQGPILRTGPNSFTADMFPNRTALRPYCRGYAVILSQSLISSLVVAAKLTPLLHVEDFYLYGVLPFVVGGVDVYDLGNKRAFHDFGVEAVNCYENMGEKCPYVASKAYGDRFKSLWDMMRARMLRSGGQWDATSSLWHIPNYKRNF